MEYKNNHYVQEELQKRWLIIDGKKKYIQIYNVKSKLSDTCGTKKHWSFDNGYDLIYLKENIKKLEKDFSILEGKFNVIFNKKISMDISLNDTDRDILLKYTIAQLYRVPEARKIFDENWAKFRDEKIKDFNNDETKLFDWIEENGGYLYLLSKNNDFENIYFENMKKAYSTYLYMKDSRISVIKSRKEKNFIISQNPVRCFNLLNGKDGVDFTKSGCLLMFPISPYYAIIIWDDNTYYCNSSAVTDRDIDTLNALSMEDYTEVIYLNDNDIKSAENILTNIKEATRDFISIKNSAKYKEKENVDMIRRSLESVIAKDSNVLVTIFFN